MKMPSYINKRDTIVQPNDAFDLDVVLVNFRGFPVNLNGSSGTPSLRFTIVSEIGGWHQTVYNSADPRYNPEMPIAVEITDPVAGEINLKVTGGVLNILAGYTYFVEIKDMAEPDTSYKTVAKGSIEIFNR